MRIYKKAVLISTLVCCITALMPLPGFGAGMERPADFADDFRRNHDHHLYHYPSPYERVNAFNGRYNVMFGAISLPLDGDLSLTVLNTWDYYVGFTSVCDEDADACTTSTVNLTHTCSVADCGAECDSDDDCDPTPCEDGCVGNDYYDS